MIHDTQPQVRRLAPAVSLGIMHTNRPMGILSIFAADGSAWAGPLPP